MLNEADDESTSKPFHSKRSHKKSRLGCITCKRRKVKCDEVRPICRSCGLRNTTCEWPDDSTTAIRSTQGRTPRQQCTGSSSSSPNSWMDETPDRSCSTALTPLRAVKEPLACLPATDVADMKLMWFYTMETSSSLLKENEGQERFSTAMRTAVVQEALENPFLLKSLLAMTGLHMRQLGQEIDTKRLLKNSAESYEGYRCAVERAKPETFNAILANSLMIEILASDAFRNDSSKTLYILDWMLLWRGIKTVMDIVHSHGWKQVSPGIKTLFTRPEIDFEAARGTIPLQLAWMISHIEPDDEEYAYVETYRKSLLTLATLYQAVPNDLEDTMILRIVTLFTFFPVEFYDLALAKKPRALVLLAHYGVFLKLLEHVWWLEGIGERCVVDICQYLGAEWHHVLGVPLLAAQTKDQAGILQILGIKRTKASLTGDNMRTRSCE